VLESKVEMLTPIPATYALLVEAQADSV
jgi:hypothetical protein